MVSHPKHYTQGDIECIEPLKGTLVEVTMAEGRTQTMMEIWPIERHLMEFKEKYTNDDLFYINIAICYHFLYNICSL